MSSAFLVLFGSTILQNASFTLVSRARNSPSLLLHGLAATLSNGIWLLVLRQVVTHLDSVAAMGAYVAGSVVGSVGMHVVSMRWIEPRFGKGAKP